MADLPSITQLNLCLLLSSFAGSEPKELFAPPKPVRVGRLNSKPKTYGKLGSVIRDHRERVGSTQGEFAQDCSLSQGYLSQLENGEVKNPSAAVIVRVAKTLGIDADDLFEAAGYPTFRNVRDLQIELRSKILPDLYNLVAELPRESQRHLLGHLKGIQTLFKETAGWGTKVTTSA